MRKRPTGVLLPTQPLPDSGESAPCPVPLRRLMLQMKSGLFDQAELVPWMPMLAAWNGGLEGGGARGRRSLGQARRNCQRWAALAA